MSGDVKPIRTKAGYEAALLELKKLWGAKSRTTQGDRLDALATLIGRQSCREELEAP